jgi:capsular polysaccharide biosynthesis protein
MKTPTERAADFMAALRRRWPAALAVFVLTIGCAVTLTTLQHKKYDATAQILLQPTDAVQAAISPGSVSSPADAQRDVNTYAKMITVDPVAGAVRSQLRLSTTLHALLSRISVSGEETSNLVSITARDPSPAQAARLASAFATQYQAYRRQTALAQIGQALAAVQVDPQAKIAGSPLALRAQQLQAAAAAETGGVQIIRPAVAPSSPASPKLITNIVVGLMAALILAIATVLTLEAFDRRLLGEPQFEAAFDAPVLGVIPGGRKDGANGLTIRRQAYTDLAARIAFTDVAADCRAIMISPASERERGAAAALSLTQALAMMGRGVVLIEADIGPHHAPSEGESDEPSGLTSVLTGRARFEHELAEVHFVARSRGDGGDLEPWALVSYLALPPGPRAAEPEGLLGRDAMREVLEQAKLRGDLVLVSTAPLERPSAMLPLARVCDGIIVLAQEGSMKAEQAQGIASRLAETDASLLGTVILPAQPSAASAPGFSGLIARNGGTSANGNGSALDPRATAAAAQDD